MVRRDFNRTCKSTSEQPQLQALSSDLNSTAQKGYAKLAELVKSNPSILESTSRKPEEVQQLLAKAYTASGKHEEAEQIYQKILTANNMMLLAQIDAAMNYQLWSKNSDADKLKKAMLVLCQIPTSLARTLFGAGDNFQ